MQKIYTLSSEEAKKIAAGEVVERPANVVKELVENALDAGASSISILIEEGGKKLIRVIDNGCGMSIEDAHLCTEHHATSKIRTVEDLTSLQTFGFRGEALSSIAAVSELTLKTKEASAQTGIQLVIDAGSILSETVTAGTQGTDISVKNIFYNVPARQKFLKTKETEWRAIVQLFHAFCLAYKQVSFKLTHNDRTLYTIPSVETTEERIGQIFEPALKHDILIAHAQHKEMGLSLVAACSPADYTRFDRSQIFCFVNNRWVKNYILGQALIKAYQGMLQPQRYPAGVLYITVDHAFVDINIHPRKEEVQFLHPRILSNLIEQTIKEKLEKKQQELFRPARAANERHTYQQPLQPQKDFFTSSAPRVTSSTPTEEHQDAFLKAVTPYFQEKEIKPQEDTNLSLVPTLQYRLIGQVHTTYILIEIEESLVYIDQHAAHERVIYENLKAQFEDIARVRLLFPQVVSLTETDLDLLEPHLQSLKDFGIDAQRMAKTELVIHETPLFVKNQSLNDCMKQAVALLYENDHLTAPELQKLIHERMHALLSCKAAVKAGDTMTDEAMHKLIKELYTTDNKMTCPHGRPTLWEFRTTDLEKKFKRDYRS